MFFLSAVWGALYLVTVMLLVRFYLPILQKRIENGSTFSTSAQVSATPKTDELLKHQKIFLSLCIVLLACLCGYRTAGSADVISNLKLLVGFCVLSAAAVTDLKTMTIPNDIVVCLPICRILFLAVELATGDENVLPRLISSCEGAVFCLVVLVVVSKITNGGLGLGDVKLLSGLGVLIGIYAVIYTLVLSCFATLVVAVILLATKRKTMKDAIPMGPCIFIGYIFMILLAAY